MTRQTSSVTPTHPDTPTPRPATSLLMLTGALLLGVRCSFSLSPPDAGGADASFKSEADLAGSDAAADFTPAPADLASVAGGTDLTAVGDAQAPRTGTSRCGVSDACVYSGSRDLALWPFDTCSPWNHPLGDGAQYETLSSPALWNAAGDARTTAAMNAASWSHPVYAEDPSGGRSGTLTGHNEHGTMMTYHLMLPSGTRPALGDDAHLHLVDVSRTYVYEMYQATVSGDAITAVDLIRNELRGSGVFDGLASPGKELWHGVRAYGGSAIGGLIRKGELAGTIRHALAVAVRRAAMNKTTANGMGYVWPASYRDDGWTTTYGSTGNLHMGSLLAIAASEDLSALFRRERITDTRVQAIAAALKDYGAYVVDATSDNLSFYAEPAALDADSIDTAQLSRLLPALRVVGNSDAQHVGGGGRPRQCFAPDPA